METLIKKTDKVSLSENMVFLVDNGNAIPQEFFSKQEIDYVKQRYTKHKKEFFAWNRLTHWQIIQFVEKEKDISQSLEKSRKKGDKLQLWLNDMKIDAVTIVDKIENSQKTISFIEGMALGNYQFLKYKKPPVEKQNTLKEVCVYSKNTQAKQIEELNNVVDATYSCRDLINEPNSYLTAAKLSEEIIGLCKGTNIKVDVLKKEEIKKLKMGGLLGVNRGSVEPPTFTIMEWKPKNCKNKNPYVFIGKGIVFDTGGINLKPSNSLDGMKGDMAGAAAVACAMVAIARAKLPIYVVGLIPATDNRPSGNALVPDDVITMHDGTTVEITNTDAEGRLILADALSYAKKYDPKLVVDIATLTGSATVAIGRVGIVAMQSNGENELEALKKIGMQVYERIVEFPFWSEYEESLKSEIADIKNCGSREGGAIIAGKFLEHFTSYPYIHLDIAGPAYIDKRDSYRGSSGTGVGVRLFYNFIRNK